MDSIHGYQHSHNTPITCTCFCVPILVGRIKSTNMIMIISFHFISFPCNKNTDTTKLSTRERGCIVTFSLFIALVVVFAMIMMIRNLLVVCQVLSLLYAGNAFTPSPTIISTTSQRPCYCTKSQLNLFNFFNRFSKNGPSKEEEEEVPVTVTQVDGDDVTTSGKSFIPIPSGPPFEPADVVIVGGGVSGLTAAIKAAEGMKKSKKKDDAKVVLLEASSEVGGRVKSQKTDDGFVLDEGFAVFIEEYPEAKKLLDYNALKLKPFLPGALVKLKSRNNLARVADPLREPSEVINALLAPVGSLGDKIDLLPLILNVRTKSIEELFEERDTDTETALVERWGFTDDFISKFFKPFLEGIYLAPLSKQSSRMFSFVFKMFSEGSATLPEGGIGAVSAQLAEKAEKAGVTIYTDMPVTRISTKKKGGVNGIAVECKGKKQRYDASSVVVATDGKIAQKLLAGVEGFESLTDLPEQPQLSVGCLYYTFQGDAPVQEPFLILNGIGEASGTEEFPVNNVCFPSVVNRGYAPEGYNLCSVTVLGEAMELYKDRSDELDQAVRRQISTWFRDNRDDILEKWELKKVFYIPNAQPSQFNGPFPASVNGGRPCGTYRGKALPDGVFVCGDHMATATLNGALESGVTAGVEASKLAAKKVAQVAAATPPKTTETAATATTA